MSVVGANNPKLNSFNWTIQKLIFFSYKLYDLECCIWSFIPYNMYIKYQIIISYCLI